MSGAHVMDLDVTEEQLAELKAWPRRKIQEIFPQLTNAEREFLLTGYTQDDWDEMFKGDKGADAEDEGWKDGRDPDDDED